MASEQGVLRTVPVEVAFPNGDRLGELVRRFRSYAALDYVHAGTWNGSQVLAIERDLEDAADMLYGLRLELVRLKQAVVELTATHKRDVELVERLYAQVARRPETGA